MSSICSLQNALSGTPTKFDGGYYAEVIGVNGVKGQFGWFASDMHGFCNTFKSSSGGGGGGGGGGSPGGSSGGGGSRGPSVVGRKLMQVCYACPTLHPRPCAWRAAPLRFLQRFTQHVL